MLSIYSRSFRTAEDREVIGTNKKVNLRHCIGKVKLD